VNSSWLGTKTWENVRNWKLEFAFAGKKWSKRAQVEPEGVFVDGGYQGLVV
jgi:hypothetical protein